MKIINLDLVNESFGWVMVESVLDRVTLGVGSGLIRVIDISNSLEYKSF